MNYDELLEERERITHDFISAMCTWLEMFNDYSDALIENSKQTEKILKEVRDGR